MLVSTIQQRESAIPIHIFPLIWFPSHLGHHRAMSRIPCSTQWVLIACASQVPSVVSNFLQPYGLQPAKLLCPWDSPGKNIGVGCCALLQGTFLTQGSNLLHLRLLHWLVGSLPLLQIYCYLKLQVPKLCGLFQVSSTNLGASHLRVTEGPPMAGAGNAFPGVPEGASWLLQVR